MVFPIIPAIMGASLAISAGSNLYRQYNQRKLYSAQENAYRGLHEGYKAYLEKQGRSINPNRAWTSYYGRSQALQTDFENSLASSVGTVAGTFGAGAMYGRHLYSGGRSYRRL